MANKYAAEELKPDMTTLTDLYANQNDPRATIDEIMTGTLKGKGKEEDQIRDFYTPKKKKNKPKKKDYGFWDPNRKID